MQEEYNTYGYPKNVPLIFKCGKCKCGNDIKIDFSGLEKIIKKIVENAIAKIDLNVDLSGVNNKMDELKDLLLESINTAKTVILDKIENKKCDCDCGCHSGDCPDPDDDCGNCIDINDICDINKRDYYNSLINDNNEYHGNCNISNADDTMENHTIIDINQL